MANNYHITGNLTAAPDFGKEDKRTSFRIGHNPKKGETLWLDCVGFDEEVIDVAKTLDKGAFVDIEGYLKNNVWTDKEGRKRDHIEVVMTKLARIEKKSSSEDE